MNYPRKLLAAASLFMALSLFPFATIFADEKLSGRELIEKSQLSFYYAGDDMNARVLMELIAAEGGKRIREMTMLRKNIKRGGDQKYYIYFHHPADVRGTAFMVWKYPARDDDRWLFIPAINLVRRIVANDKRSSFVGSDFTYEDVSGRDIEADTHKVLKEEVLNERECFVIESIPTEESEYTKKLSWIDKKSFLPIKEEYYDKQGELYKVFTADEIRNIGGFETVTKRTMKNLKRDHRTEVTFKEVQYNVGMAEDIFSERYLRRPPGKFIR